MGEGRHPCHKKFLLEWHFKGPLAGARLLVPVNTEKGEKSQEEEKREGCKRTPVSHSTQLFFYILLYLFLFICLFLF